MANFLASIEAVEAAVWRQRRLRWRETFQKLQTGEIEAHYLLRSTLKRQMVVVVVVVLLSVHCLLLPLLFLVN